MVFPSSSHESPMYCPFPPMAPVFERPPPWHPQPPPDGAPPPRRPRAAPEDLHGAPGTVGESQVLRFFWGIWRI